MKEIEYNSEKEWLEDRRGRITGTKASGIVGKKKPKVSRIKGRLEELEIEYDSDDYKNDLWEKLPPRERAKFLMEGDKNLQYYEIIADWIAVPEDDRPAIQRGKEEEDNAIERFEEEAEVKVDDRLVMWVHDENEHIALSPDGKVVGEKSAVEVKCLKSAKHLRALVNQEIPSKYEGQVVQYFVVNEELEKMYFVFYDPRMPVDLFWIEFTRDQLQDEIEKSRYVQEEVIRDMKDLEQELTF